MLPRMERLQGPFGMYGTVYGFNTAVVHIAHPNVAKSILMQPETGTSKRPAYNHFDNFCGRGVFTAHGNDWKDKRTAVLHALVRGNGSLEERVLKQAHQAANELVTSIKQATATVGAFNVVPLIQHATIGLIFRYITHQDIPNSARQPLSHDNVYQDTKTATSTTRIAKPSAAAPPAISTSSLLQRYLDSVTNIRMIILAQSRSIWFLLPRWCYTAFARLYRQEEDAMTDIRMFAHLACQEAIPDSPLDRLRQGTSHLNGKRMRSTLTTLTVSPTTTTVATTMANTNTTKKDHSVSQDLLEEAITLLFAGQDTSAATLSWTLHLLSLHPDIQQKLSREVRSVLHCSTESACSNEENKKSDNVYVTKAMIGKMPYLDAVVKESMRLYPVAPFVVRKLTQDIHVSNDGRNNATGKDIKNINDPVCLPKGAMACLWIYGLHHHPDYWSNPEDFIPERWLTADLVRTTEDTKHSTKMFTKEKDAGISNGAYMPFAVGPRNCLGQPLAQWILRALLARIVDQFDFRDAREVQEERDDGSRNHANGKSCSRTQTDQRQQRQDMQAGFTVLPQGGVHLVAKEAL